MATYSLYNNYRPQSQLMGGFRDSYTPSKYTQSHVPIQRPASSYGRNYQYAQVSQAIRDFSRELDNMFLDKKPSIFSTPKKNLASSSLYSTPTRPTTSHYRTNSSSSFSAQPSPYRDTLFDSPSYFQREELNIQPSNSQIFSRTSGSFFSKQQPQNTFSPSRLEKSRMVSNFGVLPPNRSGKKYTLVLDLDETLTHTLNSYGPKIKFLKRPFVDEFLREMSLYYEIVIFTAAMQEYADEIINQIDTGRRVSHRLYRQHLQTYRGDYVKDLSILGRDLSKTLIIDNLRSNFVMQPNNGFEIQEYRGQSYDTALRSLANALIRIAENDVDDVRDYPIRA